jgi:Zn-dependent peptidase ImmA (M78 family)/transcriptional regulator with XRE-family HTH domain
LSTSKDILLRLKEAGSPLKITGMKSPFAERLKLARSRAGLSQDQLVNALEKRVSKNAISKYEKGLMMPDSEVLIALSKALGVKTDFFFRKNPVDIPEVKFRKTTKLKTSDIKQIKALSTEHLERYLEIENLLMLQKNFQNPLADHPCRSVNDARQLAVELRNAWSLGLNPIPNVVEMLEHREVKIQEFQASESFDGLSTWVGEIPLIVLNASYDVLRKRFTALHELGHLVLNINRDKTKPKEEESYCNAFANEMLLPSQKLIEKVGEHRQNISLNELIDLKEYYGISLAAIMYKVQEMGILPETRARAFWQHRRQNRDLMLESDPLYGEYKGSEASDRFMQLIYRAAAEEIISLSKAASLANIKLAEFREHYLAL